MYCIIVLFTGIENIRGGQICRDRGSVSFEVIYAFSKCDRSTVLAIAERTKESMQSEKKGGFRAYP